MASSSLPTASLKASSLALYHYPGASSLFPYILLSYSNLPFTLEIPNPGSPEYSAINPKKQVPALGIDDVVVTENNAIAHAINHLAPEAKLFGNSALEFVKVCEWLSWLSTSLHAQAWGPYIRPWRFLADEDAGGDVEARVKAVAAKKVKEKFEAIETSLRDDGSWAVGEAFTAADAFLVMWWGTARNGMGLDVEVLYPRWTKLVERARGIERVGVVLNMNEEMKAEMGTLKIR